MEDWFNTNDEDKKDWRRKAADAFLQAIANDPGGLRKKVLMPPPNQAGNQGDGPAKAEFNTFYKQESGIDIPDSVRVLCLEPDLSERGKLVVFVLPTLGTTDPDAPLVTPDWGSAWEASWPPY